MQVYSSANSGRDFIHAKKVFRRMFLVHPICSDKMMMVAVQLHNRTVQATACAQYLSLAFTSSGLSPESKTFFIYKKKRIKKKETKILPTKMFFKWNQDLLTRARDLPVCNWTGRGRWRRRSIFSRTRVRRLLLIIQELLAHGVTKL